MASESPIARYISRSSPAKEPSSEISSSSASPSASSCAPSAARPHANCATFVRSRQSMQCERSTPRCATTPTRSRTRSSPNASEGAAANETSQGDAEAPASPGPPSPRPVTSSHSASRHASAARAAGPPRASRSWRAAAASSATRGPTAKIPTSSSAPAATRAKRVNPSVVDVSRGASLSFFSFSSFLAVPATPRRMCLAKSQCTHATRSRPASRRASLTVSSASRSASRRVSSRRRRSLDRIRLSATVGAPYLASHKSKCRAVASYALALASSPRSPFRAESTISGRAATTEASCDQNTGMDPRICTALDTAIGAEREKKRAGRAAPTKDERDAEAEASKICSVSTSFATRPRALTPRRRYLVPAKCRDRRATSTSSSLFPSRLTRRRSKKPCTRGTSHRAAAAPPSAARSGRETCAFHANGESKSLRARDAASASRTFDCNVAVRPYVWL